LGCYVACKSLRATIYHQGLKCRVRRSVKRSPQNEVEPSATRPQTHDGSGFSAFAVPAVLHGLKLYPQLVPPASPAQTHKTVSLAIICSLYLAFEEHIRSSYDCDPGLSLFVVHRVRVCFKSTLGILGCVLGSIGPSAATPHIPVEIRSHQMPFRCRVCYGRYSIKCLGIGYQIRYIYDTRKFIGLTTRAVLVRTVTQ
jgi:hypothetical protein